jgi:hypothetical protein
MLLLSLGLHGLLLLTPTPSEKPKPPAEEKVSLTELPTENQPVAPPSVRPLATPRVVVTPAARPVVSPPPRRVDAPPPLRSTTTTRQSPVAPQPSTPAQPTPNPTVAAATTSPLSESTAPIAPATSTAPLADPFTAGFPIYPGTEPGSFGLPSDYDASSRRTDDDMEKVNDFYVDKLPAADYVITAREQPGRTVYQVTKGDRTQYLTLIPNPEGAGTSILLSEDLLPTDLAGGSVESQAVKRFYSDLPIPPDETWENVGNLTESLDTIMPSPTDFFTSLGGIDAGGYSVPPELRAEYTTGYVGAGSPESVFADLQQRLDSFQFSYTPAGSYGSGSVYEVSRTDQQPPNEQVTRFLVLVPTLNGAKTLIFVCDQQPGT